MFISCSALTRILYLLYFFLLCSNTFAQNVKIATFNTALNRSEKGALLQELLADDTSEQMANVAEIIQRVRPDILVLQEFDYDDEDRALRLFEEKYLSVSQNGAKPLDLPYFYLPETNTGYDSGEDLDNDGKFNGPGDAYGYGAFPGQYGFLILSKYPIAQKQIRTFQQFLWEDMPEALLPVNPKNNEPYYKEAALKVLRLSSKNHVDLPVVVGADTLHILVSHPTPPVFDGPEDRNGKRNYDEIRLWADYISGEKANYLYDDKGYKGGLPANSYFLICGDQNADPLDGDSYKGAINQLLNHPNIQKGLVDGKLVPSAKGGVENAKSMEVEHKGDPAFDTSGWGLRVDYVLPSTNLTIRNSGIFWPKAKSKYGYLVAPYASSDHRLVWVEVGL